VKHTALSADQDCENAPEFHVKMLSPQSSGDSFTSAVIVRDRVLPYNGAAVIQCIWMRGEDCNAATRNRRSSDPLL